jgi:hypothetical protein
LRERFTPVGVAQAGRPLRVVSEDLGADHPHQVTSASASVPQRTWSGPIPGRAARASPFRRGDVACLCAAPRAPPGAQSGPSRRPRACPRRAGRWPIVTSARQRIAHLLTPQMTSAVKPPAPSGVMTRRPRA